MGALIFSLVSAIVSFSLARAGRREKDVCYAD